MEITPKSERLGGVQPAENSDEAVTLGQLVLREAASAAPYKEYRAILSQYGTSAPAADDLAGSGSNTAFIDTIGGVWSYNATGSYYYTKTGAFANSKKVEVIFGANEVNMSPKVGCIMTVVDANALELRVGSLGAFANPTTYTLGNSLLYVQPVIIRVYN